MFIIAPLHRPSLKWIEACPCPAQNKPTPPIKRTNVGIHYLNANTNHQDRNNQ